MPSKDSLSSTDKLLDLIRGNKKLPTRPPVAPGKCKAKVLHKKNSSCVAVHLDPNFLYLVKIFHIKSKPVVADYQIIPLQRGGSIEGPGFVAFLRSHLQTFCDTLKKPIIWATMPTRNVELLHIAVPPMPKKDITNAVYWAAQKEKKFDLKTTIFDFRLVKNIQEKGNAKQLFTACIAPRAEVTKLSNLFTETGYPLAGITIMPFCLENIFCTLRDTQASEDFENIAHVFIGSDWSRIDIFSQGALCFTRNIKTGTRSLANALNEGLRDKRRAEMTENNPVIEDLSQLVGSDESINSEDELTYAEQLLKEYLETENPNEITIPLFSAPPYQAIRPAANRLVRQMEQTFEHYLRSHQIKTPLNRVYISGQLGEAKNFLHYLQQQIALPVSCMDPLEELPLHEDVAIPESLTQRVNLVPALGAGFSCIQHPINFLNTYKEKEQRLQDKKINKITAAICLFLILAVTGGWLWQYMKLQTARETARAKTSILHNLKAQCLAQETRLQKLLPQINRAEIRRQAADQKSQNSFLADYSSRFRPASMIAGLVNLSPNFIKLHKITAYFAQNNEFLNKQKMLIEYTSTNENDKDASFSIAYPSKGKNKDKSQKTQDIIFPNPFGKYTVNLSSPVNQDINSYDILLVDGIVTGNQKDILYHFYTYKNDINASSLFSVVHSKMNYQIYPDQGNVIHFTLLISML